MKFKLKMDNIIYDIAEVDVESQTVILWGGNKAIRIPIYYITDIKMFTALKLEFITEVLSA